MSKSVILLFIWIVVTCMANAQTDTDTQTQNPPNFSIKLSTDRPDTTDIHVNDEFVWEVHIRWSGGLMDINPEIIHQPDLQGLETVKTATVLKAGGDDAGIYSEKVFQYTFRAVDEGSASIGPVGISYQKTEDESSPATMQTTPETVTILPERFSIAKTGASLWKTLWFKIALVLFILIGISVTCFLYFRKPSREEISPNEDQADPVEEQMNRAKSKRIDGSYQGYYSGLEAAVRFRLHQKHPGVSSTSLRGYLSVIPPEKKAAYERFMRESEEAKYAPVAPSAETLDRAWDDVKRIVSES